MQIKKVLASLSILPSKEEIKKIAGEARVFVNLLNADVKKEGINAEIFLGGSFAKGTLVKKERYDIDIFVRFDWRYDELTVMLARLVKRACGNRKEFQITRLHGSRDYFRIIYRGIIFEVIPVLKISKPKEERNVTDLSYFHVSYVKNQIKRDRKLMKEVALAKTFCRAQGCYGAESYIQGFSGYGLECLIIYYKSFEKMARALENVKERLIIDPAKQYKNKNDILYSINESKLHSPIILADPTWKERNVLAALSHETFRKFQLALKAFLKKPSISFFKLEELDFEKIKAEAKEKNAELLHLRISTDRQAGDIAGTKLKKFSQFLARELSLAYLISREEFAYDENKSADAYYMLKPKIEIIKRGPPISMKKDSGAFKKVNKNIFTKDGRYYSRIRISRSGKYFLRQWIKKKGKKTLEEMQINDLKVFDNS